MSASSLFENKAFQKTTTPGLGFNLVPQVNNFNSVFNTQPLELKEADEIEKLLLNSSEAGKNLQEQIEKDVEQLKLITAEIKAIGRQGTILIGERVHRARELLKSYIDGTFTKWLDTAFGARRTGYNMLTYYDLYTALPRDELRERLKKFPQRAAYMLASRVGDIDIKAEIISEYHDRTHDELVCLIKEKLPLAIGDKRSTVISNNKLIAMIRESVQKLQSSGMILSEENKKDLVELSGMMSFLSNV